MAEEKKSIRTSDENMEKFKEFAKNFENQHEAFSRLLSMAEMQNACVVMPGAQDMIDSFQGHLHGLEEAFVYALKLKEESETLAKESVARTIESKDKQIMSLQEKSEAQKAEIESLKAENKESKEKLSEALKTLQNAQKEVERAESSLVDKAALLAIKEEENVRLTKDVEIVPVLREKLVAAREAQKEAELIAEDTASQARSTIEHLNNKIESLKKEAQRDAEVAKLTSENEKRAAVLEAKEEAQKKIDAYVAKIEKKDEEISILQKENAIIDSLREEIERLKVENINLKKKASAPATAPAQVEQITIEETELF